MSDSDNDEEEDVGSERERKEGMQWLNEPDEWMQHRTVIQMEIPPGTDCWRKTTTDGECVDTAPFYYLEVDAGENFEVRCKIKCDTLTLTDDDQAGLMIRHNRAHWIKCGLQIIDEVPHFCATITHDASDMSMHPLPHIPEYLWLNVKKIRDGLEIYVSEDSHDWMQIRQGDIQNETILQIGLYGASPSSDNGFDVTFEDFMFKVE